MSLLLTKWHNYQSHRYWGNIYCPKNEFQSDSFRFLCRLWSIAAHRDHFVWRLSVRPSVHRSVCLSGSHTFLVVMHSYMFRRRHMHSLECCHYVVISFTYCGLPYFRGVPIFVVFVEGPIHEFGQYQQNSKFLASLHFSAEELLLYRRGPHRRPRAHTKC